MNFIEGLEWLISTATGIVWSKPIVLFILVGAIYFSFKFKFVQLRGVPHALDLIKGKYDNPNEKGQITHFQALAAALSGTIGLGNIAGVAIAIGLGGPGAIFWMWVVAIFGMASKFIECTLGTHYRDEDSKTGEVRGGPMHYILKGLGEKWRPMAVFYAICLLLGGIGAGNMFSANQAAKAFEQYNIPVEITGLIICGLVGVVIIGGIKRIGQVASKVVPIMCGMYISAALFVCVKNFNLIGDVFSIIFNDAFTGAAVLGGSVTGVIIFGVQRAIFSNETGLGTAAIAHAAVKTDYPVREGIVAAVGPFIDTIIVCTATAIVIITSGYFGTEVYQPFMGKTISFEKKQKDLFAGADDWSISNNTPKKSVKLQFNRSSEFALKHTGKSKSISQLPGVTVRDTVSKAVAEGIRFSYFKESGDVILRILNDKNDIIDMVALDKKTPLESANKLVSFQGSIESEKWQSVVLKFKDKLKEQIKQEEIDNIFIQLIPKGENNVWYFDRVQAIKNVEGIELTSLAFGNSIGKYASVILTIAVFFFGFSTIITWYYYGETSLGFIVGEKKSHFYKYIYVGCVFLGSIMTLGLVLSFADLMIGLMVVPNMIALIILAPKVASWTSDYFDKLKSGKIKPYKK